MKKIFLSFLLCTVQFILAFRADAQTETPIHESPSWTSDKGYWVVKQNRNTPKESVVYYYTNAHILVYKEEIKNKKLKLTRPQTLLRLKQSLEVAVASYENGNKAAREQSLSLQRH